MGFADNVFDQKRGRRESNQSDGGILPGVSSIVGKKRPLAASTSIGPTTPLRKIELPTPEPDYGSGMIRKFNREGSDLFVEAPYTNGNVGGARNNVLPGVKSIADGTNFLMSIPDDGLRSNHSRVSMSPGLASLGPAIGLGSNTLPPMLGHPPTSSVLPHQQSFVSTSLSNGTHHLSGIPPPSQTSTSSLSPTYPTPTSASALALLSESLHADTKSPTALLDASIADLETEIRKLRKYEEEFIELGLDDSRRMLGLKVAELEEQVRKKRKEKGVVLMERLRKEGLGELASAVGREVGI